MPSYEIYLTSGHTITGNIDSETADRLHNVDLTKSLTIIDRAGIVRCLPNTITGVAINQSDEPSEVLT